MFKFYEKIPTILIISLGIFFILLIKPLVSFAQIDQNTTCVSKTYQQGEIIPADSFNSFDACNSYIKSWLDFAQENSVADGETFNPDNADWCGGQSQMTCPVSNPVAGSTCNNVGSSGCDSGGNSLVCEENNIWFSTAGLSCNPQATCDSGYVVSALGSCVARGAVDNQYILFGECIRDGGSVFGCEELAFGGQSYLSSEEANSVQECLDTIQQHGFSFDPEYCQAALATDIYSSRSGVQVAVCINRIRSGSDQDCEGLSPEEVQNLDLVVLDEGSSTLSNRADIISGLIDYCQENDIEGLESGNCADFVYQLVVDSDGGEIISESALSTCFDNASYKADNRFVFSGEEGSVFEEVCQPIYDTANIITTEVVSVQEEGVAPVVVPVEPVETTAVVYISANNGQAVDENQRRLKDCAAAGASLSQCEQFMLRYPQANFKGNQIASCILKPEADICPGGRQQVVAQVSLSQGLSTQVAIDESESVTQSQIQAEIADCVNAGASEVDCRNIVKNNTQTPVSGAQVAECIQDVSSGSFCTSLRGIEEATYNTCSELGACVDGRTCIYQGKDILRNVGARCTDKPQLRTCEPLVDQFSTNGTEGAPCCGGGIIECGSGVCNAAAGLQGECTANVVAGSNAATSTGGGEAAVGVGEETRDNCEAANGIVQGTAENGFTLKCDFDGNGSFGYHQPTAYIYGNQAASRCQVLCEDPTADVEEAARIEYQARRIAVAQVQVSKTTAAVDLGQKEKASSCETGTFEDRFACVAWYDGVCVKQDDGCYREAENQKEILEVCDTAHASAFVCSRKYGQECQIYPTNGCYAPKTKVAEAQEQYAEEIEVAVRIVADEEEALTGSIFQQAFSGISRVSSGAVKNIQNFVGSTMGRLTGSDAEIEEVIFSEQVEVEEIDSEVVRTTEEDTVAEEGQFTSGGKGLTTGAVQNDGEFQVEGYCSQLGYDHVYVDPTSEFGWFCYNDGQDNTEFMLGRENYDEICQQTYADTQSVVAIQTNIGDEPAYNWRCASNQ
jgi:hypothetical protein